MGLGTALVNVMDAGIDIDVDQKKLSGVYRGEYGGFHVVLSTFPSCFPWARLFYGHYLPMD